MPTTPTIADVRREFKELQESALRLAVHARTIERKAEEVKALCVKALQDLESKHTH
jgi:hypothetical protein